MTTLVGLALGIPAYVVLLLGSVWILGQMLTYGEATMVMMAIPMAGIGWGGAFALCYIPFSIVRDVFVRSPKKGVAAKAKPTPATAAPAVVERPYKGVPMRFGTEEGRASSEGGKGGNKRRGKR